MRRMIFSILLFVFVTLYSLLFSSCGFLGIDGMDIYQIMDDIAGKLGESQITPKSLLIGERYCESDDYTGVYTSECDDESGRDVIFGGASVKERRIHVYGTIQCEQGDITLRVRENTEVTVIEPGEDGSFDMYYDFSTGGNYIMADYEQFSGRLLLFAEYEAEAGDSLPAEYKEGASLVRE